MGKWERNQKKQPKTRQKLTLKYLGCYYTTQFNLVPQPIIQFTLKLYLDVDVSTQLINISFLIIARLPH